MTLGKLLLQTLVAAGDSATFGALFQVEKRHYLACAITGAAGWVTYCLAVEAGCSVAAAFSLLTSIVCIGPGGNIQAFAGFVVRF